MTSMLERVARVLADNAGDGRDYTDVARVAIEAMREPTDAMLDALEAQLGLWVREVGSAADVFTAGIDAALNEQVSG